ncbi:MAG: DinB family protein [Planctomycetota bacterium]
MNWTELLNAEVEGVYGAAEGLVGLVTDDDLGWKPPTGGNWMTVGQLLEHLTSAGGFCMRGIATGEWGLPEGVTYEEMPEDEMLPAAEKMPAAASVADVKAKLRADRELAVEMVRTTGEMDLAGKSVTVPWNQETPRTLGHHFLHMLDHLASHKSQLFYYLKLMDREVDTNTLWGG